MNVTTPSLRQLSDGRWFTKRAGKKWYFGRDPAGAVRRFADSLAQWQAWREEEQVAFQIQPPDRVTVAELAEQFLDAKTLQGGPICRRTALGSTNIARIRLSMAERRWNSTTTIRRPIRSLASRSTNSGLHVVTKPRPAFG